MINKRNINKGILIASLIISFFSILTIILFSLGVSKKNIEVNIKNGTAYITKVQINKTNYLLEKFASNYKLKYKNEKIEVMSGDTININASKITDIYIFLKIDKNNPVDITVQNGNKIENKRLTNNSSDIIINSSIKNGLVNYIKDSSALNILFIIFLYAVFSLLFYYLLLFFDTTINKNETNKAFNFKQNIGIFLTILLVEFFTLYALLSIFNIYMLIIYGLLFVFFLILYLKKLSKNLSNLFFVLVSILGTSFILLLPPFHVPDEAAHYFKAYSIFKPDIVTTIKNKKYINLSEDVSEPINMYNMDLLGYDYKVSVKDYFSDKRFNSKNSSNIVPFYFNNTANLKNFSYIPAALIIKASELLGFPLMVSYTLAKIINLLIFMFIGFHVLKILPKFNKIYFMIMLFPITIQQVSGINQDSLTISLCILLSAYLFEGIYSKSKLKLFDKIIFILVPIMLGFCKIGYFPVSFLILLIKNDKFSSKTEAILFKIFVIVPCLLLSGIQYLAAGTSTVDTNFYPISMIFSEPITILKICMRTFLNRFHFDMLTGLVDGFGWSTVWNYKLFTYISSIIFLVFLIFDGEKMSKVTIKQRIFYLACVFIMIGFIYASLLFGWTPIGNIEIDGLQCRYFIIPALLFYISISNDKLSIKIKNRECCMAICVASVYIICFFSILYSFYL